MRDSRGRTTLAAVMLLAAVGTGCAATRDDPVERVHVSTPRDSPVRHTTDEAQADLLLWISNQSFEDSEVGLTVRVGDVPIADGRFVVQDQHSWVELPLLEPGKHEITASATTGVRTAETFEIPATGEQRYAMLSYWFSSADGIGRLLDRTWSEEPRQFG